MFNVESHPAFGALKKLLSGVQPKNFPKFIETIKSRATAKADGWKTDTDNYGFSKFEKRFSPNGAFDEASFKNAIKTKVLGDALEVFAGFFCQWFETDIVFGVKRGTWTFTGGTEDLGCDAVGTLGTNGEKCFVQVKYRSSPLDVPFDLSVFSKLVTQAIISYGLDYTNPAQRLVFFTNIPMTRGDKAAARTLPFIKLASECKVPSILIGKNEIEAKVGDKKSTNKEFWTAFNGMFSA